MTNDLGPGFCWTCGEPYPTTAALDAHQLATGHELDQPDHPLHQTTHTSTSRKENQMPRTANWPSREEWAANAEHYARTQCYTWQRVSTEPSDWLTPAELDEARALAVAIIKATRTALTRAGRSNERPNLNAHGREAAQDWNDVNTLVFCWGQIARIARSVEAAPEKVERLAALSAQMTDSRDKAAQAAEDKAVADAIASRNSDAGWAKELERRARFERGPQITTITVHGDGSSTVSAPRPYEPPRGPRR